MALKIRVHERFNEAFSPKTVKIGNQTWMAENLAVDDGCEGIFYNPRNNEYYYTWGAAMRVSKYIQGWHLPTAKDWKEAALACGATEVPYDDYTNYEDVQKFKTSLDIKFAGYYDGTFNNIGYFTTFWTSTEYSSTGAYFLDVNSIGASMGAHHRNKLYGNSVRLVKD